MLLLLLACVRFSAPEDPPPEPRVGTVEVAPDASTGPGVDPGAASNPAARDDDGDGFTELQGDCEDRYADIFPGAPEVCNRYDDDCDGTVDEGWCGAADGWIDFSLCESEGQFLGMFERTRLLASETDELLCEVFAEWVEVDGAMDPCPECDWWFHVQTTDGAWMAGDRCGDVSLIGTRPWQLLYADTRYDDGIGYSALDSPYTDFYSWMNIWDSDGPSDPWRRIIGSSENYPDLVRRDDNGCLLFSFYVWGYAYYRLEAP